MPAASLLIINDGTLNVEVPSCAMYSGNAARADTGTGHGEIEYADGHGSRWVRFQRLVLSIAGNGPAPHGLWALDLTVATWNVQVTSFNNDASLESWTVVPARPADNRGINAGRTSWSLTLQAAQAEIPT